MSASSSRVTVVIPNWNGRWLLPDCLDSLAVQNFRDFEILLVDNASSDDGLNWVEDHHPEVTVVRREINGGFAAAVNAGIRVSRGEYVALLNNDTVADPAWLGALVAALDARRDYDFAASLMVLHGDPGRVNAAGDVYSLARLTGKNRGYGEPIARYREPRRVLGACAGAALYRRALFDHVGLFDEDFFLMSEDTDFSLRCLIAGRKCLYVPGAVVRHKFRASIETAPVWEMTRLAMRNAAMVAAKDLPAAILVFAPILWPWRLIRETLPIRPSNWHLAPMLVRQAPARLAAECEGARIGWAKRPGVLRARTISTFGIIRWLVLGVGKV
jgi:GT2 family glycosyltransferase